MPAASAAVVSRSLLSLDTWSDLTHSSYSERLSKRTRFRTPTPVSREPIMYLRFLGGANLQHHALGEPPAADDAVLEEMQSEGWLDIDYREKLVEHRPHSPRPGGHQRAQPSLEP